MRLLVFVLRSSSGPRAKPRRPRFKLMDLPLDVPGWYVKRGGRDFWSDLFRRCCKSKFRQVAIYLMMVTT